MKITQVERQKKNQKRFNVYLDGKFAFGADEDAVVDHRLIVGKEILEEELERILFATEVGKLMERMYGLFSVRMRSEKEVWDYLRQLSFKRKVKDQEELSDVVVEALIERLKEKDLLNDARFADEWIRARRISKNKGINAIKAELFQKGISRDAIDEAVEKLTAPSPQPSHTRGEGVFLVDPSVFEEPILTEEELAMKALEKKVREPRLLEDIKEKQRILGFLMRKGFTYEISREAIEKFLKKE